MLTRKSKSVNENGFHAVTASTDHSRIKKATSRRQLMKRKWNERKFTSWNDFNWTHLRIRMNRTKNHWRGSRSKGLRFTRKGIPNLYLYRPPRHVPLVTSHMKSQGLLYLPTVTVNPVWIHISRQGHERVKLKSASGVMGSSSCIIDKYLFTPPKKKEV